MPAGRPWPLGVEWVEEERAFNFALYSRHATGVTLLCYAKGDPDKRGLPVSLRTSGAQDRQHLALPHPGERASRSDDVCLPRRWSVQPGTRAEVRSTENSAGSLRTVGIFPT